jgi:hypothetical protein
MASEGLPLKIIRARHSRLESKREGRSLADRSGFAPSRLTGRYRIVCGNWGTGHSSRFPFENGRPASARSRVECSPGRSQRRHSDNFVRGDYARGAHHREQGLILAVEALAAYVYVDPWIRINSLAWPGVPRGAGQSHAGFRSLGMHVPLRLRATFRSPA